VVEYKEHFGYSWVTYTVSSMNVHISAYQPLTMTLILQGGKAYFSQQ